MTKDAKLHVGRIFWSTKKGSRGGGEARVCWGGRLVGWLELRRGLTEDRGRWVFFREHRLEGAAAKVGWALDGLAVAEGRKDEWAAAARRTLATAFGAAA